MLIKTLVVGGLDTNCYVVTDEKEGLSVVIDPGDESNTILDYIESNKLNVRAILLTHGHHDHTKAAKPVSDETGAPIRINKRDVNAGGPHSFYSYTPQGEIGGLDEGDTVRVGSMEFRVLETPGHSPGSVSLVCGDTIFSGDTLFRDSCGRTDLDGGDMDMLISSLRKLDALPGNYEVYPGHADCTDLDRERNFNYYIRYAREQQ